MENSSPHPTGVLKYDKKNAVRGRQALSTLFLDSTEDVGDDGKESSDGNDLRLVIVIRCSVTYTFDSCANVRCYVLCMICWSNQHAV